MQETFITLKDEIARPVSSHDFNVYAMEWKTSIFVFECVHRWTLDINDFFNNSKTFVLSLLDVFKV